MRASSLGVGDMPPTTASIDINRPVDDVFAYVTDPSRFSEWQKGVVSGRMESTGTPGIGDRCLTTRHIGFTDRQDTSEVVRFDPPCQWGVRGLDGPIRAVVDVTVERQTDTNTRVTIAVDFEGHGIGRLIVPLLVRSQARREMPVNVTALKQRLEGP